jgi:hypothetical protein
MRRLMLLSAGLLALMSFGASVAAKDLAAMGPDEVTALQRRLTDAGCYRGAINGASSAALEAAVKACPDQEPVLRIETGMHTAAIFSIGVDAACRLMATGSEDKTLRLWSLPEGRLLRTERLPIGDGNYGKVYAVAVSPDGRYLAAGGWDAFDQRTDHNGIYLFDAATGASRRHFGAFGDVVNALAFSADGKLLAVALGGDEGVRVLDTETGRELMADTDFKDASYGVAFGPNVDIFDATTLRRIGPADTRDLTGDNLSAVAWSTDSTRLMAGGAQDTDGQRFVRTWDANGRRSGADRPVAGNTIMSLKPCGDAIAFGAADPSFGLLRPSGAAVTLGQGRAPDMRGKIRDGFMVSVDGTRIRFGVGEDDAQAISFDLAVGAVEASPRVGPDLRKPNLSALKVSNWEDATNPTLNGKPIELDANEWSHSLAVRPDRGGFVLGTSFWLRAIAGNGRELWHRAIPGDAWGVNLARNGELIVAAYDDGTVRWYRWSDGKELLAFFVHKDDKRWVAWTPTGYYMASPGAEALIGWHVNRGWEQPADFFPASRFRERFNRPDVVQLVLQTLDEETAVKRANDAARRKEDVQPLAAQLPPVIRIVSPADGASVSRSEVTIGYELRSPSGLAVDHVEALIDGRPQTRGLARVPEAGAATGTGTLAVAVPQRDAEVTLIAHAGGLASEPARIRLVWQGSPPPAENLLKPKLYALVVGVSDYVTPGLALGYAAKDARDFAKALESQRGGLYGAVETRVVTDRDVTRVSVLEGLEWLEKQVTSRDVGIVFLAGHGHSDERKSFWFLPSDASPQRLRTMAVSQDDIRRTLQGLAGKAMLFLDTCHAGQALADGTTRRSLAAADVNAVVNELSAAENGVIAFASSTGREVSVERPEWQNGAFTKALVEALAEGRADLLRNGTITVSQLDAFVVNRVKELTGGLRHPVMTRPPTVPDFPIAVVRKQ